MSRRFTEPTLLIASGNAGKVKELGELLAGFPVELISAAAFNLAEPEETGQTFLENARIKSEYYSKQTGLPALADDSGLVVDALGGAPGVYSARWAGETKDFSIAFKRIANELQEKYEEEDKPEYAKAHFVCALSLYWPDGHEEAFEGRVYGSLVFPPRGNLGFGYDPIFIPSGKNITFGEMLPEEKHKISHRADAFSQLVARCFSL